MAKNFFLKSWDETSNGINSIKNNIRSINFDIIGESGAEGQLFKAILSDKTYVFAKSSEAKEKYKFMFQKENMIGESLQKLREYIPNFMLTFGSYECPSSNVDKGGKLCDDNAGRNMKYYILLEPVDCPLDDVNPICNLQKYLDSNLFNAYDYVQFVQILVISLLIAKEECEFTHNDFNPKNICLHDMKTMTKLIYKYHGIEYTFVTQYLPVIVDYGPSYSKDLKYNGLGTATLRDFEELLDDMFHEDPNRVISEFITKHNISAEMQNFIFKYEDDAYSNVYDAPSSFFPTYNTTIKEDIETLINKSIYKCERLNELLNKDSDEYLAILENIKNGLREYRKENHQYNFTYPPASSGGYYEKYQKYKKIYLQKKYGI